jgi:hypothetical protein
VHPSWSPFLHYFDGFCLVKFHDLLHRREQPFFWGGLALGFGNVQAVSAVLRHATCRGDFRVWWMVMFRQFLQFWDMWVAVSSLFDWTRTGGRAMRALQLCQRRKGKKKT